MCEMEKRLLTTLYTQILMKGNTTTLASYGKLVKSVLADYKSSSELYIEAKEPSIYYNKTVNVESVVKSMKRVTAALLNTITDEVEFTQSFTDHLFVSFQNKLIKDMNL